MTDDEFIALFVEGRLAPESFDHRAHVRAACCLLASRPFLEACIAMRDGVRLIAARAGRPDLYHETVTIASMSIVFDLVSREPDWPRVDALLDARPELLDRTLLTRRYSRGALDSPIARRGLVLPDLAPISGTPASR